jgi:hypothetical protein
MLDWWLELPRVLKVGFSLAILGASAAAWFAGFFWPWGWGVGAVLFAFSFADD